MAQQKGQKTLVESGFGFRWIYLAIVVAVSLGLYVQTTSYTYTELDDSIFISDNEGYNRAEGSFAKSFRRGVFSDSNDTYYRPLLLNSFVLDRKLEGKPTTALHANKERSNISRYHWTNILLHVIAVGLLYLLLGRLLGSDAIAFILSLLFAVHPALAQTVAWVPGRNDSLLAVFTLSFLLCAVDFVRKQNWVYYLLQLLLLLCALLTKETGIIAAPLALVVFVVMQGVDWKNKKIWWLCASWIAVVLVWFLAFRSMATVKNQDLTVGVLATTFIERLPLLVQYLGKIILPFNLTVFPQQQDTTLWYGVGAILLLGVMIALAQKKNWRLIITGCVWFLAFVFPVLIVPKSLNQETFEHRLYLPIIGILLLLAQALTIKGMNERLFRRVGIGLALVLGVFTFMRSDVFADKWKFWERAVADSPSSAYAKMMLGMRYYNDTQRPAKKAEGEKLLMEAYVLNPDEKYLNHYIGRMFLDKGQLDSAEYHYNRELQRNPNFFMTIPDLARVNVEQKDFAEGEKYLLQWLAMEPSNVMANGNLLILYTNDLKKPEKARAQALRMQQMGLAVPDDIAKGFGLTSTPPVISVQSGGNAGINNAPSNTPNLTIPGANKP